MKQEGTDDRRHKYLLTTQVIAKDPSNPVFPKSISPIMTIKSRSESNNNIFQLHSADNQTFKEYKPGPIYDKNGVVPRSIVGKPETYDRLRQLNNNTIKFMATQNSVANKFAKRLSQKRLSQISLKSQKSVVELESKNSKRPAKDYEVLSQYEVQKQLQSAEQRIKKNEELLNKQVHTMQLSDKLKQTKEERVIQKYQKQQQTWIDDINRIVARTNRHQNDSVIANSQSYRRKVESIEYNEALKLMEGQKTVGQWYMSLRSPSVQQDNPKLYRKSIVRQDVTNNFNTLIVDYTLKPLEVIRQPSFYSHKLNNSKSKMNSSGMSSIFGKLPFYKRSEIMEDDLEGLQVEGASVLKLESEMVEADCSLRPMYRLYKQQPEVVDEQF